MKNDIKFKILLSIIALLSFLGFLDSTYLTILHYKNAFPSCSFTHGCETVQTSQYSTISNLPVALLGSIYYLVLTIFSIIFLQLASDKNSKSEARNPKQYQKSNDKNSKLFGYLDFKHLNLFRVSIFDIRIYTKIVFFIAVVGFGASVIFFSLQAFAIKAYCEFCLLSELISTLILTLSFILIRIKIVKSSKLKI